MPKSKHLKQHEAKVRELRGDLVHAARALCLYRRDVKARLIMYHRDDHRFLFKRLLAAWRLFLRNTEPEERSKLFTGWALPDRYKTYFR